jgi:predicted phage baseplate assembly protein
MRLDADDPGQFGDQPLAGALPWGPRPDLLASDRFAQEFVVETESDGSARLRFGDDRFGLRPEPGTRLLASYRQGVGAAGNVGAGSITRLVCTDTAIAPFVRKVRNPMPAQGGTDPEVADAVKLRAPEAFRTQERAVTEADYARVAERHPQVQRAAARLRWTGSWYTMFVSIDRKGGAPLDDEFRALMLAHLERYRLAGYDLDLQDPAFAPLDIELGICVQPAFIAAAVKQSLLLRLSSGRDAQGQPGFFHPDRFSFGTALALSALVEAAQATPGVASVDVLRFQRWGRSAAGELESGVIGAAPLEVLRLDNDPNFPENGRLVLTMRGGL